MAARTKFRFVRYKDVPVKLDLSKLANTYLDVIRELRGTHFFKVLALTAGMLVLASLAIFLVEHREELISHRLKRASDDVIRLTTALSIALSN